MLQALHAEWQKARRRHDLVLCLTFAVILYLWLGSTAPTGQDELANAYSALFFGTPIINTILLPVLMGRLMLFTPLQTRWLSSAMTMVSSWVCR